MLCITLPPVDPLVVIVWIFFREDSRVINDIRGLFLQLGICPRAADDEHGEADDRPQRKNGHDNRYDQVLLLGGEGYLLRRAGHAIVVRRNGNVDFLSARQILEGDRYGAS